MGKAIYEITVEKCMLREKNKLPVVYENKNWVVAKQYGEDSTPITFSRTNLYSMEDFNNSIKNNTSFCGRYYAGDKNSIDFFSGLKATNEVYFSELRQLEAREKSLANKLWDSKNNISRYEKMIECTTQDISRFQKELEKVRKDIEGIKLNALAPKVE